MRLLARGAAREDFSDKICKGDGLTRLRACWMEHGLEDKSTKFRLPQAVIRICVQAAPQTLTHKTGIISAYGTASAMRCTHSSAPYSKLGT